MDTVDMVLLSIKYFGGDVKGKTLLQKRIFFLGEILKKTDLAYFAHYYGPYSQDVADSIISCISDGYVQERVIPYGIDPNGFEMCRYEYSLTEKGDNLSNILQEHYSEESKRLKDACTNFLENAEDLDYITLSYAAKVYFVLKQKGKPLTPDKIKKTAETFQWKIEEKELQKGVKALKDLQLIEIKA
jgi:uncharacterized protein YwgA